MFWIKINSLIILVLFLIGCTPSLEQDSQGTVEQLLSQKNLTLKDDKRVISRINITDTTNNLSTLKQRFPKLVNPAIYMFVYPHIVNDNIPVPGYMTVFNLYEKDVYALPHEIIR